jgi:hypothetical protein
MCVPLFGLVGDVRNTISENVGLNGTIFDSYSLCISAGSPWVFTEAFCVFRRSVQHCAGISHRLRPIPSKSPPCLESPVFLPFDALLFEIPKKSSVSNWVKEYIVGNICRMCSRMLCCFTACTPGFSISPCVSGTVHMNVKFAISSVLVVPVQRSTSRKLWICKGIRSQYTGYWGVQYILLSSCGTDIPHPNFWLMLRLTTTWRFVMLAS